MSERVVSEHGFSCPHCGSPDVRRSRRHGMGEVPKMLLGVYPFRCLNCGERFFGNVWLLATKGYANCPKCLRLDVQPWVRREGRVSAWDQLRMILGAQTYRCIACRYTFLSFRKGIYRAAAASVSPEVAAAQESELESTQSPTPSSSDAG